MESSNQPQAQPQEQPSMADLLAHIGVLTQQVADLHARPPIQIDAAALAAAFPAIPAPIVHVAAPPTAAARAPSVHFDHDVEAYDGKATTLESFLFNVQVRIDAQKAQLVTDDDKIKFFATNLGKGAGWSFYQSLRVQNDPDLQDYAKFLERFKKHFGDANLAEVMDAKLDGLKQTGSVSTYTSKFNELSAYVDLSEYSKCKAYFGGLKQEIKDVFKAKTKPKILNDLQIEAANTEARIRSVDNSSKDGKSHSGKHSSNSQSNSNNNNNSNRASNQRGGSSSSSPSWRSQPAQSNQASASSSSRSNDTVSLPTDTPMQVDAVKMSRMTPAQRAKEKARRLAENLCFWCSADDHKIQDCPTAPAAVKNKSRIHIAAANDSSSGKANPKA